MEFISGFKVQTLPSQKIKIVYNEKEIPILLGYHKDLMIHVKNSGAMVWL
jgi:hypothetical protein